MLLGKHILLGVTGGIAAYKSTFLVRELIKAGASVQVVLTPSALDFVTPLTLSTLSKNPVFHSFQKSETTGEWVNHVSLSEKADAVIIAPATANTLSKLANGFCDNLLLAAVQSATCPIFVAPAMDLDMWKYAPNQKNIATLTDMGMHIIPPGTGELASGLSGTGRMEEPEIIAKRVNDHFALNAPLKDKTVLITAGPTQEPIDPVRYITNHSSGKMGYAIAEKAIALGAKAVHLVSGPTQLNAPKGATVHKIVTAQELFETTSALFPQADIAVLAAAVSDFTPKHKADKKLKKGQQSEYSIAFDKTPDTLAALGKTKAPHQTLVGFALETDNEEANALGKLQKKNLDFIVLNSLQDKGAGFSTDTNKVTIFNKKEESVSFPLQSKSAIASHIWQTILSYE